MVHPLVMVTMSAKFNKEICYDVVSIVFTRSTDGRMEPRTDGTTAALLYPHRNALRWDKKSSGQDPGTPKQVQSKANRAITARLGYIVQIWLYQYDPIGM